jgi:choline dehydrogenase-like flavoprotein
VLFQDEPDLSGKMVASGVQIQKSSSEKQFSINCTKEVILSSGSIGSTQLLQVSGVGDPELLSRFSIKTKIVSKALG